MHFNSFLYLPFLACAAACYWALPARFRPWALLVSGLAFYGVNDPRLIVLIGGMAAVAYAAGKSLCERPSRSLVMLATSFIVLLLVFFKYAGLIVMSANSLFGGSLLVPSWVLPLGISFFTFEFVHYVVDCHRGKIPPHGPLAFLSFTFFFPTLVSGPIKRFQPYAASLADVVFHPATFWTGLLYILLGFSQKYLFADPLIPFTSLLAYPDALPTRASALGGLFLYSWRIYFDFAGLSNIAIGSALLLGILVPKNFSHPYFSPDIQQFWRRWHMSLGSWVRDYIYIPLGGSRVGPVRMSLNLVIAMTIVGIWHGAGWNFAVWGLYHGVGLALHRAWRSYGGLPEGLPWRILGALTTFSFVTVGWAFFATSSLSDSWTLLHKAFLP